MQGNAIKLRNNWPVMAIFDSCLRTKKSWRVSGSLASARPRPDFCLQFSANIHTMETLALAPPQRYLAPVAANSATGFGDPNEKAQRRPDHDCRRFFLRPQFRVMAAVRGRPSGLPSSFSSVRQPAYSCHPNRLATVSVVLQPKRTACMSTSRSSKILASVLHLYSWTTLSYFTSSQSRSASAQSEVHHD